MKIDFQTEDDKIFSSDKSGTMIAEITFPKINENTVDINHTFVDPSLRGRGVADKLMCAAVDVISSRKWHTYVSCPYARKWFSHHPEYQHLLRS